MFVILIHESWVHKYTLIFRFQTDEDDIKG